MKKSNILFTIGILLLVFGVLLQVLFKEAWITKIVFFDKGLFPFVVEILKCAGATFIVTSFVPKSDNFSILSERQRKSCIQEILAYEEDVKDSNSDISIYFSNYIDELFDLCTNRYRTDIKYIINVYYDAKNKRVYADITNEYKEYKIKGSLQEHFFGYYEDNAENKKVKFYDKSNKEILVECELGKTSQFTPEGFPKTNPFSNDKNVRIIKYYKLPKKVNKNNFIRIEREIRQFGNNNSNIMLLGIGVIRPCYGMDIQIHMHDGIVLIDKNTFGDFIPNGTNNTDTSIRLTSYEWMKSGLGVDFVFQKC